MLGEKKEEKKEKVPRKPLDNLRICLRYVPNLSNAIASVPPNEILSRKRTGTPG